MLGERVKAALDAARRAVSEDVPPPAQAVAALGDLHRDGASLAVLFGPAGTARRILITDRTDPALYRIDGVVTEFLPLPDDADTGALAYAARRLGLCCAKWRIGTIRLADPATRERLSALLPHDPDLARHIS